MFINFTIPESHFGYLEYHLVGCKGEAVIGISSLEYKLED